MAQEYKLTIEIKNSKPVELIDLTNSLLSVASEYRQFLISTKSLMDAEEIKLYIKEIKSGSIVTDIIAIAPGLLPIVEHARTIIEYAEYLKKIFDFFANQEGEKPELTRKSYENIRTMMEVVAKDRAAQINFFTTINGNVTIAANIDSKDANTIQNESAKEFEKIKIPVPSSKSSALLYWHQARNDSKSRAGDRAVIESIARIPVKTLIPEKIKNEMLAGPENPFQYSYVVDVDIETINDIPVIYKITALHDKFEK